MPIKIYVGNYPSTFVEDDVLNLFQDYEGVELAGFYKDNFKCYSFLHCVDVRQLVEIVANLHDIDVCGRNLIVRAADENFHNKIKKSLGKNGVSNFHPKNTCDTNNESFSFENNGSYPISEREVRGSKLSAIPQTVASKFQNTYPKKHQMSARGGHLTTPSNYSNSRFTKPNEKVSTYENNEYFSHFSESDYLSQQSTSSSESYLSGVKNIDANSYCPNTKYFERKESARYINRQEADKSAHHKNLSGRVDSFKTKPLLSKETSNLQSVHTKEQYMGHSKSTAKFSSEIQNSFSDVKEKSANSYCQRISESKRAKSPLCINPQETFSKISKPKTDLSARYKTISERFDSFRSKSMYDKENPSCIDHQTTDAIEQHKPRNRNASESSYETVHNVPDAELYENLSFVSVVNFPLNLPIRSLYELFADFDPVKIFTVCNKPRVDRAPTEALVCFENEENATEAILTLDNTIYQGRVLLVTDAVDMSMVSELLNFGG